MFYAKPNYKASTKGDMFSVMAHSGKWSGLIVRKNGYVFELAPDATEKLTGRLKKAYEKRISKEELSVEDAMWLAERGASIYAA